MNIQELKIHFKKNISVDLSNAIDGMEKFIRPNTNMYDDLVILKSRLNILERREMHGVISSEERTLHFNKILKSAIDFVNLLTYNDIISGNIEYNKLLKVNTFSESIIDSKMNSRFVHLAKSMKEKELKLGQLFDIDFNNIDYSLFKEMDQEVNVSGTVVKNFICIVDCKICNIFDKINIKVIGNESINIFLTRSNVDHLNFSDVETLINHLYEIMGVDDYGKGKCSIDDKSDFYDKEFYTLFGRNWREYPKNIIPVSLSIDREDNEIVVGIWGV